MTAPKKHHILLKSGKEKITLKSKSKGRETDYIYGQGTLEVKPRSAKVSYPISKEVFDAVYARYQECKDLPFKVSNFTKPNWADCPNTHASPYVARLILYFETES